MRIAGALLGALLFATFAGAEDAPRKKEPPTSGEIEFPDPGTPIEDRAVARQRVARFDRKMKEAGDDAVRVEAIRKLGDWDHPDIFRALSKRVRDKRIPIAVEAIVACTREKSSRS